MLDEVLAAEYGIDVTGSTPIHAGTDTRNYRVASASGELWFAKVYRGDLGPAIAAIEVAEFARAGGIPVPELRRTCRGELLARRIPMSLWRYLPDTETGEGGLTGRRCTTVGTALGALHRRLAGHPAAAPAQRPGSGIVDPALAQRKFARLIAAYEKKSELTPFEEWALQAARERLAVLPRVAEVVAGLPELTVQVLHGDLAAPNLLLTTGGVADEVAAFIDFQPPTPGFLAWEIARIGCDPRTVVESGDWLTGLVQLVEAYRRENPAVTGADIAAVVACGCAYTLASTYPLAEHMPDAALQKYARARHESGFILLDHLPAAEKALHSLIWLQ